MKVKKILSLFLSLVMLLSITAGLDLSADAADSELKLNSNWVTNNISENVSARYYRIKLEKDGFLELSLMHYFGARIQLYNEDMSQCILNCNDSGGTSDQPTTNIISGDFSKGVYFVKICGYLGWSNSVTGKYKLKGNIKFFENNETEPNDFDNAMHIKCEQVITGAITIQDSIDWFKIICNNKSNIEISLTHYFGIGIEVFNSDLSECVLKSNSSNGNSDVPSTLSLNGTLNSGIYYVKVKGYLGWSNPVTGKYRIKFTGQNSKSLVAKATTSKNGSIVTKCSVCGAKKSSTTIYSPKTISLSATSYTYNGKVKTPSVTVKDSKGKTLKKDTDYTVTYAKDRKAVGKYNATIKFKGNYSGTVTKTFTIKPKSTSISKLTAGKKKFTVKWKKLTTQATGYQIQYSTSSNFKSAKTVTVGKSNTTSKTVSKLSAKKKYYVRVRAYKTVKVNGKNTKIYSSWSKAKAVTTKK